MTSHPSRSRSSSLSRAIPRALHRTRRAAGPSEGRAGESAPPGRVRRASRIERLVSVTAGTGLALALAVGAAPPAQALSAVSHGIGFSSHADGRWLGSYRLDDGRLGFCIDVGLAAPPGHDYSPVTDAGRSPDDRARLAYISRRWAGSEDPATAAAGQLATWSITGLGGHDITWYAQRAGDEAASVQDRARAMLAETDGALGASRAVSASATIHVGDDGHGTVRADLHADYLAGGGADVPARTQTGTVDLVGAAFADGTTRARVPNGSEVPITATGRAAEVRVHAGVAFTDLPFGDGLDVVADGGASQSMILSRPADASAAAEADARAPSPLPFAPQVVTRTSRAIGEAGAPLTDVLHVTARSTDDGAGPSGAARLSDGWGLVRHADGSLGPVPVTVRSRLLGPFREQVGPVREDIPDHAPLVCEVATVVDHGPGDYETPPCTLPAGGFYTWVETISPDDTPAADGRSRVLPWRSAFADATETTQVPRPPTITTDVGSHEITAGRCQTDTLHVSALVGVSPIPVHVHLVGPLTREPADGSTASLADGSADGGHVAEIDVADEGDVTSSCIPVDAPGWYVAVLDSPGRPGSDADGAPIPPFADLTVHANETFHVSPPPASTAQPARTALAMTGSRPGMTMPVPLDPTQLMALSCSAIATGGMCTALRRAGRGRGSGRGRARASRWARS